MRRVALRVAAGVMAAAAGCRPGEQGGQHERARQEYAAFAAAAETPLDESLRRFDDASAGSDAAARINAAARALEKARRLRDLLETRRVSPGLAYASGEELIYANHVVDGLAAFVESDGGPAAVETLRAGLGRGRVHRDRGRAALGSARLP